jgi:hypothetical protein
MADNGWVVEAGGNADSAWDTNGLKKALPTGTNGHAANGTNGHVENGISDDVDQNGGDHAVDDEKVATAEKAKAAGWVEPTPYNYKVDSERTQLGDWEGNARVYEWDGEHGDVGPELPELELELFGNPAARSSAGLDFSK